MQNKQTIHIRYHNKVYPVSGTIFQIRVWKELLKIPTGKTRSYRELAARIGKPKAARAVANACGANPLPIIIPCHRVIASDGSLGGYSGKGGVKTKEKLLRKEKAYG
jgi:methylated-DNA-[protein]-cysteine S-methyltransferase